MIHSYSFTNFQSFKEHTEVSLIVNKKVELTQWMYQNKDGTRISKLMGVLGANGSGKTALLKPLSFLGWFISNSFQAITPESDIPIIPHFSATNRPTEFYLLFEFDQKLWRYELHCTQKRVIYEALFQKHERFNYVFTREWNTEKKLYKIKQKDFDFNPHEAQKVRENASLISTAAQYNVPLAKRLAMPFITNNISMWGRLSAANNALIEATQYFAQDNNKTIKQQMQKLLCSWDLGLSGIEFEEKEIQSEYDTKKTWVIYGKHKNRNQEYILSFLLESSGTCSAYILLAKLLPTLAHGGVAVIDELENDLHPHMLEPILELFAHSKTNPHNAQLIFSCHAAEILNLLHKSQITLVQKNEDCESSACRLDDVEGIRNDDNFYAKYMAGAYGAIPEL
ncbi:MAG: ATP-binding protein [Legionellales bacterium]|nr:ATP-binding protein [Legionellales bacterium]